MTRTNSDEAESDVDKDEDGSTDEKNGNTDDEEHRSAEATTHEHQSKDPEGAMSNIALLRQAAREMRMPTLSLLCHLDAM